MEFDLRQVLAAITRWGWLILLITILSGVVAYAATSQQTTTYSATTTLLVNPQQAVSITDNSALLATQGQAQTYVRLVESGPVLDRVIKNLDLHYTRKELTDKVEARVVMNTQLIEISVSDPSAEEAARIANSVASQFESQIEDLTIGRLEENLTQVNDEITSLRARRAEINQQLAALDTDANAGNTDDQSQIDDLKEEQSRAEETIADLQSNVRSINAALATTTSPVEVADQAQAAREPVSPKPLLMTALGLFLGLLVGAGLAAFLEFTDKKIRADTDVEALTNSRLLVTVPIDRKKAGPMRSVLTQHDDATVEAIRILRTRLGALATTDNHNAIVFASAGGTDQTSTIVANLGVVMAQSGVHTVILDANLRNPLQHELFDIANDSGLSSMLENASGQVEGIDANTVAPRLSVVTAGASHSRSAELVGSATFASLLDAIRNEANVVLMDTPSAVESSDAFSMAAVADGVILVGQYGSTLRDDLGRLAEAMQQDGMRLIGVVMIR